MAQKRPRSGDDAEKGFKKVTPHHLQTLHERDQAKRLIVILEGASLETIKVLSAIVLWIFHLIKCFLSINMNVVP